MKYTYVGVALVALLTLTQCKKDNDLFMITTGKIGPLTKEARVNQLDSIFSQDSVIRTQPTGNYFSNTNAMIEIYEKGGAKLLQLTANEQSTPQITNIQVFDSRYQTDKGLHLNSTFKDIKDKYQVKSIHNGIQNLVISLEDSEVYITVDKVFLADTLRNQMGATITTNDIPDHATFKFFMIGWSNP